MTSDGDSNDDRLRKALKSVTFADDFARLRALADSPDLSGIKAMQTSPGLREMMADIDRHKVSIQAMLEPISRFRALGTLDPASPLWQEARRAQELAAQYKRQFQLPELSQAARMIREYESSSAVRELARHAEQALTLQKAIEGMTAPWVKIADNLHSIAGFAEIQGIGQILQSLPPFDDAVAAALRSDLGDWRDPLTLPVSIGLDSIARSQLYVDHGFKPALTEFPPEAFDQALSLSGLSTQPPSLIVKYGGPISGDEDNDLTEELARAKQAYEWLHRLETEIRQFIDRQMTAEFGPDWPKHRLPNGMYDKWIEKKKKDEAAGAPDWPLICYADFTEYESVINRADNWVTVFCRFFGRKESVRESLQRLQPIRLTTMHIRMVTQDDVLFLMAECRRLGRAMRNLS